MARQTWTLAQVVADYLPPDWTDGPRWLSRQLNKGQLKGVKMGRTWMMRQSDIDYMLDKFSNADKVVKREPWPELEPEPKATEATGISFAEALSPRSRSRLRTVTQ